MHYRNILLSTLFSISAAFASTALASADLPFFMPSSQREAIQAPQLGIENQIFSPNALLLTVQNLTRLRNEVSLGSSLEEAMELARRGIQSDDVEIVVHSIVLFKILVRQGHFYNEATQAAQFCMKSKNKTILVYALSLFRALIEKEQSLEEAYNAAETARREFYADGGFLLEYDNDDVILGDLFVEYVSMHAMLVLHSLIQKKYRMDDILRTAAVEAMSTKHYQQIGLFLYTSAAQHGEEYAQKAKLIATQIRKDFERKYSNIDMVAYVNAGEYLDSLESEK